MATSEPRRYTNEERALIRATYQSSEVWKTRALFTALPAAFEAAMLLTAKVKGERKELYVTLHDTLGMRVSEEKALAWSGPTVAECTATSITITNGGPLYLTRPGKIEINATIDFYSFDKGKLHVVWSGDKPEKYSDGRPARYDTYPTIISDSITTTILDMRALVDDVVRELDLFDPYGAERLRAFRTVEGSRKFKAALAKRRSRLGFKVG